MADPEHVVLAKSGATAIAKWREVNYLIPNTVTSYSSVSYTHLTLPTILLV